MSQKANPTIIGVFTLTGILLATIGVILFGAGQIFDRTHSVILYFEKSANGLQVGSDVRFGGVRIGRVRSINVLIDEKNTRKIIPVVVDIGESDLRHVASTSGTGIDFSSMEGVAQAVSEGLRARMKQQSLLTGQLYVEFDIVPDTEGFVYTPSTPAEHPSIPTIDTEMDELIAGIADGIKTFTDLDLEGIVTELKDVLATANAQLKELDTKSLNENFVAISENLRTLTSDEKLTSAIANFDETMESLKSFSAKLDEDWEFIADDLAEVLDKAVATFAKIEEAASDISDVANPRAPVLMRFQNVLQEMERASRAITELADDLRRNPNAIITGKERP